MSNPSSAAHRPPFAVQKVFLETAFEQRFQGILRHAWRHRSWHVIAALPGSGKSLGIQDLVLRSGARKERLEPPCFRCWPFARPRIPRENKRWG